MLDRLDLIQKQQGLKPQTKLLDVMQIARHVKSNTFLQSIRLQTKTWNNLMICIIKTDQNADV